MIRSTIILAIIAILLASLALGCGRAPTEPGSGAVPTTALSTNIESGSLSLVGGLLQLIVRTLNLIGSLGGTLTNGRWRVDVPPDAIEGTAVITLAVPSLSSSTCQLEISPASKNSFSVPATLTADCRGVPESELRSYVIFWFDPNTKVWVPVSGSRVDLTTKTVSAPLLHFSTYSVGSYGKSGW